MPRGFSAAGAAPLPAQRPSPVLGRAAAGARVVDAVAASGSRRRRAWARISRTGRRRLFVGRSGAAGRKGTPRQTCHLETSCEFRAWAPVPGEPSGAGAAQHAGEAERTSNAMMLKGRSDVTSLKGRKDGGRGCRGGAVTAALVRCGCPPRCTLAGMGALSWSGRQQRRGVGQPGFAANAAQQGV